MNDKELKFIKENLDDITDNYDELFFESVNSQYNTVRNKKL